MEELKDRRFDGNHAGRFAATSPSTGTHGADDEPRTSERGPYETSYDIVHGYSTERPIVRP